MKTWSTRFGALILLAALLTGCCGEEAPQDEDDALSELAGQVDCPALVDLQRRSGLSIGGIYGEATFAEYLLEPRAAANGFRGVHATAPNETPCAQDIARRLEQTCDTCSRDAGSCQGLLLAIFTLPTSACSVCGDSRCTAPLEDTSTCALDCRCGDGSCDVFLGEDLFACPQDCRGTCGDGFCAQPVERCECPEGDPSCTDCPRDCCVSACGDGRCDVAAREHLQDEATWCELDCGPGFCGDGSCQATENSASCPQDCAQLIRCGDGTCASPETPFNCPQDCRGGGQVSTCLDGVCAGGEFWTCASDCAGLDFACGDGTCAGVEDAMNCPMDCPAFTCGDATCEVERGETQLLCQNTCEARGDRAQIDACHARCPAEDVCQVDGYCSYSEMTQGRSCIDCVPCTAELGLCVTGSASCGLDPQDAARHTILRCEDGSRCGELPAVEPCEGACRYTEAGPACSACPTTLPDVMPGQGAPAWTRLCPEDFTPTCVGPEVLRTCAPDPAYSTAPGCQLLTTVYCRGGCFEGACNTQPRIGRLEPGVLTAGDTLNIHGFLFEEQQGSITFSPNLPAAPTLWSDTRVEVVVPAGAASGPITLTTAAGDTATAQLTVITAPTVLRSTPAAAERGATLTLEGLLFGADAGQVRFAPDDRPGQLVTWADRRVEVIVPAGATSGAGRLVSAQGEEAPFNLQILPSIPMNPVLSVTEAHLGAEIEITGAGFGIEGDVLFWVGVPEFEQNERNGIAAEILAWSPTRIRVRVPDTCGTSYGGQEGFCSAYHDTPVVIRTPDGRAVTAQSFRALPTLTQATTCGVPWSGSPYDLVEIRGAGFEDSSGEDALLGVTFATASGEVEVPPGQIIDPARLLIAVPPGAVTGPLTLRWRDGDGQERTSTTEDTFTVIPWPDGDSLTLRRQPGDSPTPYCIDGTQVVECASAPPQDGTRAEPTPQLIPAGAAVVADGRTGLLWAQQALPSGDLLAAQCACREATPDDQPGWRLPSGAELASLVDYGALPGAGLPAAFAPPVGALGLWAREADSGIASSAYGNTLNLENGLIQFVTITDTRYGALCVKRPAANLPTPRFATQPSGESFLDQATGLQWTRRLEGTNQGWGAAIALCDGLTRDGQSDWRLPTAKEYLTLIDFLSTEHDPAPFEPLDASIYLWTATPFRGVPTRPALALAATTHLNGGLWMMTTRNSGPYLSNPAQTAHVICVR